MKEILTVFTPAYNRAYILSKCYASLLNQTDKNFKWLIVDDGSTDNTRNLVESWISENKVKIKYIYQENQGMHGAHNTAYEAIDTDINICIDSDDYMPNDAVENIIKTWNKVKNNKNVAGIIGLDAKPNGEIIGTKFKKEYAETTLFDFYNKEKGSGDKKLVYRTSLTKLYPYPIFKGEKYVGLDYKYHKIGEKYSLLTLNKVFCIVEYLEDGSSRNMLKQYRKNPKGFLFYRIESMKNPQADFKFIFRNSVHYVSSSIICRDFRFLKKTPKKIETLLATPFGILLYIYIMQKTKDINEVKN